MTKKKNRSVKDVIDHLKGKKKKVVKVWAVIDSKGKPLQVNLVYSNAKEKASLYGASWWKVVPCTITFTSL